VREGREGGKEGGREGGREGECHRPHRLHFFEAQTRVVEGGGEGGRAGGKETYLEEFWPAQAWVLHAQVKRIF